MSHERPKLLWIGESPTMPTGLGVVSREILNHLQGRWEIAVLGAMYQGDPHEFPYPIYPPYPGGDHLGMGRTAELVNALRPDVVMVVADPWVVERFVPLLRQVPSVAMCPVDAPNFRAPSARALNQMSAVIYHTAFGLKEAQRAGFQGRGHVVGLGVDLATFHPVAADEARAYLDLPREAFIVGAVARNQPRKRLDLTVRAFAQWAIPSPQETRLYLHTAPIDVGYDLRQLAMYYRVEPRVMFTPGMTPLGGLPTAVLRYVYSSMDVLLVTSLGEGWGLPVAEAMACGVPVIAPDWAALSEWPRGAVEHIGVQAHQVTPEGVNTVGGVIACEEVVGALARLSADPGMRAEIAKRGLALVAQPEFAWPYVADRIDEILEGVID